MDVKIQPTISQQQGQALLVDLASLGSHRAGLCRALETTIRLSYLSPAHSSRIPYFQLCAWNGMSFHTLFEFQSLKENYDEAIHAIISLSNMQASLINPNLTDCQHFWNELVNSVTGISNIYKKKPVVSIFTMSSEFLEQLINSTGCDRMLSESDTFDSVIGWKIGSFEDPNSELPLTGNSIATIRSMIGHPISFDRIFKTWLTDKSVENATFRMQLPSGWIECDILELMIDPYSLMSKGESSEKVFIKNLRSHYRLPISRFSHDMLYDCPFKVVPTCCWKMDFEDLAANQNLFIELCASLCKQNEVLILEMINQSSEHDPFYAFFPGEASAIVAPVIFNEIFLPPKVTTLPNDQPIESHSQINLPPLINNWNPYIHAPHDVNIDTMIGQVEK